MIIVTDRPVRWSEYIAEPPVMAEDNKIILATAAETLGIAPPDILAAASEGRVQRQAPFTAGGTDPVLRQTRLRTVGAAAGDSERNTASGGFRTERPSARAGHFVRLPAFARRPKRKPEPFPGPRRPSGAASRLSIFPNRK